MSDGDPLPSLTRQLRELHQRLDPTAPRHMANGKRKAAIQDLLSGAKNDGKGSGSKPESKAPHDGSAAGSPRPRSQKPRREASGISLPGGPGSTPEPAPRPAAGSSRQPKQPPARNNFERIVRYLFLD